MVSKSCELVAKKTVKNYKNNETSVGERLQTLTMFLVPQFDFASFQYLLGTDGSFFHPLHNKLIYKIMNFK